MDFAEYLKRCTVKVLKPRLGTGFWVTPDGYILTCFHVVKPAGRRTSIEIEYRGSRFEASLHLDLSCPEEDIGVLQVTNPDVRPIFCAPLGSAAIDTSVQMFGYRRGFPEGFQLAGVIRAGQRISGAGAVYNLETHMPDGSDVSGMSGSPVFDLRQRTVIGIQYGQEGEGPSISYVHPIDKIYRRWPTLRERNRQLPIVKLDALHQSVTEAIRELTGARLVIQYQKRTADAIVRGRLGNPEAAQSGLCVVLGEGGIGKSTLIGQLMRDCRDGDHYLPIWLAQHLFYSNGTGLMDLLGGPLSEWGLRLQEFAEIAQRPVVLFVDALDAILPHTDPLQLTSQLNTLASNTLLICTSRPFEYEYLKERGISGAEEILLSELSLGQVREVLWQLRDRYYIGQVVDREITEIDRELLEMCRNPFILFLFLQASISEELPQDANPTDTWVKEAYWARRVERIRPEVFVGHRFGSLSKERVGQLKVSIAHKLAERIFDDQRYYLSLQSVYDLLEAMDIPELDVEETIKVNAIKQVVFDELVSEGIVRRVGDNIRFLHDSFADFVICRLILSTERGVPMIQTLLSSLSCPFYVPIIVALVLQARDARYIPPLWQQTSIESLEDFIYHSMIDILDRKREGQAMMNLSWGVTYALRQLASVWVERLCGSLNKSCSQPAASSIASILQDLRHPLVLRTLVGAMNNPKYKFRKRFVDSIGAAQDPRYAPPLLQALEHLLNTRTDDDLLENLAEALGKIGDVRAESLLIRLASDLSTPRAARREARTALAQITGRSEYFEILPYTDEETVLGLRLRDPNHPNQYSDWKVVKQTANRVNEEAVRGKRPSEAVIEALIQALNHEHEDAQHAVVNALDEIASPRVIEVFANRVLDLETPDGVRMSIIRSLKKLALADISEDERNRIQDTLAAVMQHDPNPQLRRQAASTLCDFNVTSDTSMSVKARANR